MPKKHNLVARLVRAAVALVAITAMFSALVATGTASARTSHAAKTAHVSGTLPAEGMFDNCQIGANLATCEQDLLNMHQAGLQVAVVGFQGDSLADLSAYAAYAQSIGMSIMWQINDPGFWGGAWMGSSAAADWTAFSSACGCADTTQVLDYVIQWLGALPATYGYYAADDEVISPGELGGLTQYVSEIKALDPSAMVMVGSAVSQGTSYASTGATLGTEIYPETSGNLMPVAGNQSMWDGIQQSIAQDQHAANQYGTSSAFILQAFTFGDNLTDGEDVGVCNAGMSSAQCAGLLNYPSASTQLQLRNEVLEHAHPKLILWYTFSESYGQGDRWSGVTDAVKAPYPATATAARAKHSKGHQKRRAKRHSKHDKRHTRHARHHKARAKGHRTHARRSGLTLSV
jgi:hypothetical protein